MQDDFYLRFEERFRGAPEEIKQRLSAYLPTTAQVQAFYPGGLAIDVGCGRGEWLELMQDQGFEVLGIDTNADMVESCHAKALNAECADAFEKLAAFESESVALVSGFHIAEHLPFDTLMGLMQEAHRVLKPGGLLILETPNPENLNVGLWTFYMDPTHRHPLPPLLLQFLGEEAGFAENHILKLNGPKEPENNGSPLDRVAWSLSAHPDYGLVAQKQRTPQQAELIAHLTRNDLERPLQQINIELEQLQREWEELKQESERYRAENARLEEQRKAESSQHENQLKAEEDAAKARIAMVEGHYHAARQQLHETQSRLQDLEIRADKIYHQLLATHESLSWRLTMPLRFSARVVRKGPGKLKAMIIKVLRLLIKLMIRVPGLQKSGQRLLDRVPRLRRFKDKLQGNVTSAHPASGQAIHQNEQRNRITNDLSQRLSVRPEHEQEGER
ncbi:methyltransferase domain-containing protein [Halomonas sp. HMF6819]|uniref:methyltransferase domain-containing protein n=1 Tax=Halomonas sp. HMF6819 TaxID=3373085 RepID=UPI003790295D